MDRPCGILISERHLDEIGWVTLAIYKFKEILKYVSQRIVRRLTWWFISSGTVSPRVSSNNDSECLRLVVSKPYNVQRDIGRGREKWLYLGIILVKTKRSRGLWLLAGDFSVHIDRTGNLESVVSNSHTLEDRPTRDITRTAFDNT